MGTNKKEDRIEKNKNGISKNPENNLVSEHNTLVYSKYKLSLFQQKFIFLVASHIHPDDKDFKMYQFHVKEIVKGLGLKETNKYYNQIMKTAEELMDQPALRIIEQDLETGKSKKVLAHWFHTVEYLGNGIINIQFHEKLKPYLLGLKEMGNFTSFRLINVLKLKSPYHIRLYEILRANLWKRGNKPILFDLNELKSMIGIEEDKYNTYGHFNNRILKKAQEELKEHTDIYFEYNEIKENRKVVGVKFFIYSKENEQHDEIKEVEEIKKEMDPVTQANIQTLKALFNIDTLTEKDILSILNVANNDMAKVIEKYYIIKNKKDISNFTGLMIEAIRNDYSEIAVAIDEASPKNNIKTKFHNFEQRTSQYSPEELERMVLEKNKRKFEK